MLLSIITLSFKKPELTIRCVESIHEIFKEQLSNGALEVIIVDNKSPDDTAKTIKQELEKKKYKNIKLYENSINAGFGSGCNYAAAKAKGDYLLFLNNDTITKDKGLLNMVSYMQSNPQVGILGGQLHNFDGSLQPSVGKFYTPLNATLLLLGMQKFGLLDRSPNNICQVDWVKGAILMLSKETFKKLSGFDDKIFMYTEDMELCYRASRLGYKIYFYPDVQVFHAEQGSSNRAFAIINIYKNLLYFYKKHRSPLEYAYLKLLLTTKAILLSQYGKITKNPYLANTYEQALAVLR